MLAFQTCVALYIENGRRVSGRRLVRLFPALVAARIHRTSDSVYEAMAPLSEIKAVSEVEINTAPPNIADNTSINQLSDPFFSSIRFILMMM